ncbi:MAG: type II CRISPR-associated endonuclease Cas1, partial [Oscillospiraceae bacterium]
MGFRTVVISSQSKCTYQNDYLVVRGEGLTTIHLSEIDTLLLDTTGASITAYLLCELMKWKINVIFCDEHHNPIGEILPLYANYQSAKRIPSQIDWKPNEKTALWTRIVREKITTQAKHLKLQHKQEQAAMLEQYAMEIEFGDVTNR